MKNVLAWQQIFLLWIMSEANYIANPCIYCISYNFICMKLFSMSWNFKQSFFKKMNIALHYCTVKNKEGRFWTNFKILRRFSIYHINRIFIQHINSINHIKGFSKVTIALSITIWVLFFLKQTKLIKILKPSVYWLKGSDLSASYVNAGLSITKHTVT